MQIKIGHYHHYVVTYVEGLGLENKCIQNFGKSFGERLLSHCSTKLKWDPGKQVMRIQQLETLSINMSQLHRL